MRSVQPTLFAAALALIAALPAGAASSTSSAASDSVGLSSNGVSGSLRTSSNSSSKTDVAQGEYRVVEVAAADNAAAGLVALKLQVASASGPATDDNAFVLLLPRATFERSGVATGAVVQATHRSYGLEFARADTREAFFLVLQERALQDLLTVPVVM